MALGSPPFEEFQDHLSPSPAPLIPLVSVFSQKLVPIVAPQVPWLPACGPHWLDAVAIATSF